MSNALQWDRLFQTCVHTGRNAILAPGYPPLWLFARGPRQAMLPVLAQDEISEALTQITPPADQLEEMPGCRSFTERFGETHRFRIDALGQTSINAVLVTRLGWDAPASRREGGENWFAGWAASEGAPSWGKILSVLVKNPAAVGVLSPGCPPFAWSEWGLHAFRAAPLSGSDLDAMLQEVQQPPPYTDESDGMLAFDVRYGDSHRFRVTVLGAQSPAIALLMTPSSEELGQDAPGLDSMGTGVADSKQPIGSSSRATPPA